MPSKTSLPATAFLLGLGLLQACAPTSFLPGPSLNISEAPESEVAAVIYLVGDAGQARVERTPLVHRLRREVERWSGLLPGDSSVAVVYLGDNIYPVGLRDPSHEDFPEDSAHLMAQVHVVAGPMALERKTPAFFLPGNHDWGSRTGAEGMARLRNQELFLQQVALAGPGVALVPTGRSSPTVVELAGGAGPRLVLLDTQWWLQSEDPSQRDQLLDGLAAALAEAGDRPVIVAAHHPYRSGGPHAERSLLSPLGLLARAGAVVQDLNARPYQELREGLEEVFQRAGRPLLYAAGHDHSLQLFQGEGAHTPEWTVVSGAASKRSSVTEAQGLLWAGLSPGFMRVVVRTGGRVDLFVEQAPERFLECQGSGQELQRCMEEGAAAFRTTYSGRLR